MFLLALDSSHSTGSLCLQKGPDILDHSEWKQERSHAELIASRIDKAFRHNSVDPQSLDALSVNIGPGSFTGIRIAVNTIKTLAYVFKKPIFTFNSLETIAASCSLETKNLVVAINAHSELCYFQEFSSTQGVWTVQSEPKVLAARELNLLLSQKETAFVGDAFTIYERLLTDVALLKKPKEFNDIPSAKYLAHLALTTKQKPLKWENVEPFYIRKSAPEEKRDSSPRPK